MDGQRRIHQAALQSNTGLRRLVSLVVLLILVLLMIKQVSDPKKVARVGGAVGLFPKENQRLSLSENSTQLTPNLTQEPVVSPPSPANTSPEQQELTPDVENLGLVSLDPSIERNSQVLEHLMRNLPPDAKPILARQVFGILDRSKKSPSEENQAIENLDHWLNESRAKLTRWINLSQSQSSENTELIDLQSALNVWANNRSKPDLSELPPEFQRSLRLSLDRTLLNDLSDNTPWRTNERLPLARQLIRATELANRFDNAIDIDAVPAIAIPQLLSQTDILRGRCYRLKGTIGLIDQPSSMELAEARKLNYSVLWIRPDDLSNQPVNLYIPEGIKPNDKLKVGDFIQFAGIIVKRRAYASQRGGEITPVLIATCVRVEAPEETPTQASTPETHNPSDRSSRSHRIAKELFKNRNKEPWNPPIDLQAPLELIQQALSRHLGSLSTTTTDWMDPEKLSSDPAALACLANLVKFENEIDTVVSVGNNSMLNTTPSEKSTLEMFQPILGGWNGHVTKIRNLKMDPQLLPGLDWKTLYGIEVSLESPSMNPNPTRHTVQVLAKDIPDLWRSAQQIYQPVSIQGLGLVPLENNKPATDSHQSNQPSVILASRLAWKSTHENLQNPIAPSNWIPKLGSGQTLLIDHGWDLAQCDMLERMHGQSLGGKEARAFYTLLAASNATLNDSKTKPNDKSHLKVMDWIRNTETMKSTKIDERAKKRSAGESIQARVQVRRIQRIDVGNPQHQRWLGTNHYYQLDGIADIGPNRIEVKYGKDYEPITYERDFPITLVASQLPAWILSDPTTLSGIEDLSRTPSDLDSSASIAWSTKIRLDVCGFAYRIWKFRTPQVSAATEDTGYQQAPMLMVYDWQLARGPSESDTPRNNKTSPLASILTTLVGLAAIGWFAYRISSQSKKNNAKGLQRHRFK